VVSVAAEHLGERLARLRRARDLTQDALAERAGVSVDVVRKLEQQRKHSARLHTLHALSAGLGIELTALLGDPPAVGRNGDEPPGLLAVRRALLPAPFPLPAAPIEDSGPTLDVVRAEIARGWTLYHDADFPRLIDALPGIVTDTRLAAAVYTGERRAAAQAALGKALQLGGHLAIRLGKTDLALASLERATVAAEASNDPLLAAMITNSVCWAYQRQNRLADANQLATEAADAVEPSLRRASPEHIRVWGGLLLSAATTAARCGDYAQAKDMMTVAEAAALRLGVQQRPDKLVSVFNTAAVKIEQVRLAVSFHRPAEAVALAKTIRLGPDTPPTWRTWLMLDLAGAKADLGDRAGAVRSLQRLRTQAPTWMRHHTQAVAIVTDLRHGPAPQPPGLRSLADFLGIE
jgi:transcriptional regulator with XRE-family HTH domain